MRRFILFVFWMMHPNYKNASDMLEDIKYMDDHSVWAN